MEAETEARPLGSRALTRFSFGYSFALSLISETGNVSIGVERPRPSIGRTSSAGNPPTLSVALLANGEGPEHSMQMNRTVGSFGNVLTRTFSPSCPGSSYQGSRGTRPPTDRDYIWTGSGAGPFTISCLVSLHQCW